MPQIKFVAILCLMLTFNLNNLAAKGTSKIKESEKLLTPGQNVKSKLAWPFVNHNESKPWTWWWWHGCAVNKQVIKKSKY